MDKKTIWIIFAVGIVWVILFIICMACGKKRAISAKTFCAQNKDKALLHAYSKKMKIDGKKLSELPHTTGENLQQMIALTPGEHIIEASFASSANVGLKTRNVETENVSFKVTLEAGHSYSAGLYFDDAQDQKDADTCILQIPLSLTNSDIVKAYIMVCRED